MYKHTSELNVLPGNTSLVNAYRSGQRKPRVHLSDKSTESSRK